MKLAVAGETLDLLPDRAVFWSGERVLAFSDVHLGKAESLQAEGIAVPAEAGASDLQRLERLILKTEPREVLILGDFIHQKSSWTPQLFRALERFFEKHSRIAWTLILGNHERGSRSVLEELPLKLSDSDLARGPLLFAHGHESKGDSFRIEGHVHPVVTLREGPLRMRFPCFVLDTNRLLLPSFGTWTGGAETTSTSRQRVFACSLTEVFEVRSKREE